MEQTLAELAQLFIDVNNLFFMLAFAFLISIFRWEHSWNNKMPSSNKFKTLLHLYMVTPRKGE